MSGVGRNVTQVNGRSRMVGGRLFDLEAMTMLRAVNVHKAYGPHVVLQGITFSVARGDRAGIVGANGSGKSTLLRVLAGEPPDAGTVDRLPSLRVGLLPQELPPLDGTLWEVALGGAVEVTALRAHWEQLAARLGQAPRDEHLLRQYGEIQEALEHAGGFDLEHRAREVLGGLGLSVAMWERPVSVLSGGERTRLNLARLLLQSPDVLLLDEPTNHLDVTAIEWLEVFLRAFRGAVVLVSHDRRFLNMTVTRILELEGGVGREYRGNYDAYRRARRQELASQAAAYAQYREEVERLREFVRQYLDRAGQIQQGPKRGRDHYGRVARKVARRAKAVEGRLARLEADAPDRPQEAARVRVRLASGERGGPALAHLREVAMRFGDQALLHDVNLTLRRGDRVGLVGPNGSGKTTLLRLLAGQQVPTAGEVWRGPGVVAGALEQEAAVPDAHARPIDLARDAGLSPQEARAVLAALLFRGDRVFEPVGHLSGGERARLTLLLLIARRTNLLLLDEPTNHLDLPSRERFEEALEAYPGTLVVASHDRFLLDRLCAVIWALEGNTVVVFEGDYSAFRSGETVKGGKTP